MTISVSDAGYRNVTREQWDGVMVGRVCLGGLHFCNPQTVGRVVGGMGVGYIFVTCNETCVAVVGGSGIYGLHKWEK